MIMIVFPDPHNDPRMTLNGKIILSENDLDEE